MAGGQEYEVNYEKDKTDSSQEEVIDAVKKAGNSRKKVEEELKKNK